MEKESDRRFRWGVATAAYQIEGAAAEDGKGQSIWDVMSHIPGKTRRGDTGDVACDHYHRFREDIKLMAELGVNAYRFSVSWSRILPDGKGRVNEKGIEFYNCLIDEMLKYGIEPFLTLYHWDLPEKLFELGGWLNPESPEWFYEYAKLVGERFGDRVKHYITLNEPTNVIEGMGPGATNAPGMEYSLKNRLQAIHNLLKAHGMAVRALRETVEDSRIGFSPCSGPFCPADDGEDIIEESRKGYCDLRKDDLIGNLVLYSDPVFLGDYPAKYYEYYRDVLPEITKEDLELISTPVDYCFHNIYSANVLDRDGNGGFRIRGGNPVCNMLEWGIVPGALYWGPKFLYERYKKPVIITENGLTHPDVVCLDGKIHDAERSDFIERYTRELLRARADGVDVRGYFYWSFMDNLEWELGFGPRFGLVYVNFDTLERIPKDSFYYYRDLIERNK
jgi:beta-glucosidase